MQLESKTKVYVVSKTGDVAEMTLSGWFDALKGGSRWEEVEIYMNKLEAQQKSEQYQAITALADRLRQLHPEDAKKAIEAINKLS